MNVHHTRLKLFAQGIHLPRENGGVWSVPSIVQRWRWIRHGDLATEKAKFVPTTQGEKHISRPTQVILRTNEWLWNKKHRIVRSWKEVRAWRIGILIIHWRSRIWSVIYSHWRIRGKQRIYWWCFRICSNIGRHWWALEALIPCKIESFSK